MSSPKQLEVVSHQVAMTQGSAIRVAKPRGAFLTARHLIAKL